MEQTSQNRILQSLPERSRARILSHCSAVDLPVGTVLSQAGTQRRGVHFPETAVISTLSTFSDGATIEVANVGLEGCTGISLTLGTSVELNTDVVQVAGRARMMDAKTFTGLKSSLPDFETALFGALQGVFYQVMVSGACNATHSTTERLARWLLTMCDRSPRQEIDLTQEFLAGILGVRRATVSEASARLRDEGLIVNGRGKMRVVDPAGLRRKSCECYDLVRNAYDRLLPFRDE